MHKEVAVDHSVDRPEKAEAAEYSGRLPDRPTEISEFNRELTLFSLPSGRPQEGDGRPPGRPRGVLMAVS